MPLGTRLQRLERKMHRGEIFRNLDATEETVRRRKGGWYVSGMEAEGRGAWRVHQPPSTIHPVRLKQRRMPRPRRPRPRRRAHRRGGGSAA